MKQIIYPPGYYDPPQEKSPCPAKGCVDGDIHGWDSVGSEVIEKCPHRCHWTEADIQAELGEERYSEMREAGIL